MRVAVAAAAVVGKPELFVVLSCTRKCVLSQVLDDITESIFMSSEACPRTLR